MTKLYSRGFTERGSPSWRSSLAVALLAAGVLLPVAVKADDFLPGDTSNFAVLYSGTGGHNLQITNVTVNGNIGVGGTGQVKFNGPGTIAGNLDFAAANAGQFSNGNVGNVGPTAVAYGQSDVTSDLGLLTSLSSTLGGEAGTSLALANGNQTVNINTGKLDANGNYVFDLTSFSDVNGNVLTINGDGTGDNVVFNLNTNTNFNGIVTLIGLTPDQVLFNVIGSNSAVTIDTNASSISGAWQGIILDVNGTIQADNSNIDGRLFGGGSNDMAIVSGDTLNAPPEIVATPEPSSFSLLLLSCVAGAFFAANRRMSRSAANAASLRLR